MKVIETVRKRMSEVQPRRAKSLEKEQERESERERIAVHPAYVLCIILQVQKP